MADRVSEPARIMLCDDSPAFVEGMRRFLEHDADLRVVAACSTGEEAVARLSSVQPSLVIMDLLLPGRVGGIEAIRQIMSRRPVPVLLLSGSAPRGSHVAAQAIAAGALDAAAKSEVPVIDPSGARGIAFRRYVKRLAAARVGPPTAATPARVPPAPRFSVGQPVSLIGIAASTGGPMALLEVLRRLPADFPIPVLVVQHIAAGFLGGLVSWLADRVDVPVSIAPVGREPSPGVWFAPDNAHLVLDDSCCLRHDGDTVAGHHRPAADLLFHSLARAAGRNAAAVVLTGMGSDGARGLASVREAGGTTVAQDEASSSIFGMPRAAIASGARLVLPLSQIGPTLAAMVPARR